jgi:hypothetical protein
MAGVSAMLSMASNTKGIDIGPTDAQRPSVAVAPQKLRQPALVVSQISAS